MQHIAASPTATENIVSPELHRNIENKVRAATLRHLLDQIKTQLAPQLASVLFIVWLSWSNASKLQLAVWLGTQAVVVHLVEVWAFLHTRRYPVRDDQVKQWEYFLRILFFVNSFYLGYAYYAFALGGAREELFILFMVGIMYIVAQFSRADVKLACCMVIPIYVGMLAAHLSRGTERDLILAAMLTLAFASSFALVLQQSKQAFDALYARFLNEELLEVLQRKHEEVTRAKQEAEMASQAKSRFFAAASHDLRQPLHALSLLIGSLQDKVKQHNALPTLQQMEAALGSLESLFKDVLDVARLEGGKVDVRIATVSSMQLFERLEQEFKAVAGAKGLRLKFRGPELFLEADEILLKRILTNLISNAIKYTDRGRVLVACRRSRRQGMATLQVFDTGIGIAAAELDHIFEDFYQVSQPDTARRKQREGVGLGLGIVKRLADLLHHPIDVRSRPDRGSMFALRVPLSQEAPAGQAKEAGTEDTPNLSLRGHSILVVDDEQIVVNAITTLLTGWGVTVFTATSEAELENALNALTAAPDFLIVDYQFEPSWTGEDVIRLVRENFRCAVPAAIMTGNVALVPQRVIRSGRVHVFAKPVSPAKLRALLHFNLVQSGRIAAVPSEG
jgi:signal transduction histidine kinase/ActR/RegA family two-component response regulator